MKRRSLLIVVALLCMASLMAAMAFTSAMVSNSMTFAVVATDEAKLAMLENPKHHGVADIIDDKMVLDFSPGMQPGSTYNYDDLFYVKNNTDKDILVGLRFDQCYVGNSTNYPVGLHTIGASDENNNPVALTKLFNDYGSALLFGSSAAQFTSGYYEGRMVELAPGEQIGLDFNFNINSSFDLLTRDITLQVHAIEAPVETPQ